MAAYTTIDDPSAHFQVETYTGAGANTTVTFSGNSDLKPDWLWIKNRDASYGHFVVDSSRNISYAQNSSNAPYLETESSALENNNQNWMQSVNTDGFTTGISEHINSNSSSSFVAWAWKAAGGTTSSNTDGSITTTLQTNSTAGFTIGTYTGSSANSGYGTIGHGLGAIPDLVIIKGRDGNGQGGAAQYWIVGAPNTEAFGNGGSKYMFLDTNAAIGTNTTMWYNTNFTTTTIPVGPHAAMNGNTAAYVFYAFKNIQGYSKIGQYKGTYTTTALNSSHETTSPYNGPFIHTGFKPAWVMIKRTDSANNWCIFDNKRTKISSTIREGNVLNEYLEADTTAAHKDYYYTGLDFLSNGFKVRGYDGTINAYGTYLYVAFAENPFVTSTGIPTTAR